MHFMNSYGNEDELMGVKTGNLDYPININIGDLRL